MDFSKNTIKIKENKSRESLDTARFHLSYKLIEKLEQLRPFCYNLLSSLKGSSDVVMEINTNLVAVSQTSDKDLIQYYTELAKKLGLDYKYRKIPFAGNNSIFSKLFNMKKQDAYELVIHIPAAIWDTEGFSDYINTCGTRYYFTDNEKSTDKLLDEMDKMTDIDKHNFFKMIVFDMSSVGNMGINSRKLELCDIKKLLNLG